MLPSMVAATDQSAHFITSALKKEKRLLIRLLDCRLQYLRRVKLDWAVYSTVRFSLTTDLFIV